MAFNAYIYLHFSADVAMCKFHPKIVSDVIRICVVFTVMVVSYLIGIIYRVYGHTCCVGGALRQGWNKIGLIGDFRTVPVALNAYIYILVQMV